MMFTNKQRQDINSSANNRNFNNSKIQLKLNTCEKLNSCEKQQLINKQLQRQLKQIISSLQSHQLNNLFKCFQIENNNVATRNFNKTKVKCIECQLIYNIRLEKNNIQYLELNGVKSISAKGFGRDQLVAQNNAMRNLLQTFISKGIKIQSIMKALRSSKYKQPLIKKPRQQESNINLQSNSSQIQKEFNCKTKSFSTKKKMQNYNNYNKVGIDTQQKLRQNKENIFNNNKIIDNHKQTKKLSYEDLFQIQSQSNLAKTQNQKQSYRNQYSLLNSTLILDDLDCVIQIKPLKNSKIHKIDQSQTINSQITNCHYHNQQANQLQTSHIQAKIQHQLASLTQQQQQRQQNRIDIQNNQIKSLGMNDTRSERNDKKSEIVDKRPRMDDKLQQQNLYRQINKQNMKQMKHLMARIKLLEEQNSILKELLLKQNKYFGKHKAQF